MVADQMEDIEVKVIDSKMLSMGLGRLVLYAKDLVAAEKYSFDEIVERVEAKREKIDIFFVVETLKYLKKGGRIGKVSGTIGELLNVKPIISIDEDGEYYTFTKVRGRKKSLKKMYSILKNRLEDGKEYCLDIMNAAAPDEAQELLDKFKDVSAIKEIFLGEISPVMVVHAGPGLLGLAITELDE